MELNDLFYKWVPVYVRLPMLFLLLFVILVGNGVFLGNTTDMFSSLGEYPEPYIQASNALYIGMGLGLMFEMRLKQRFSNKELLLYGLSMMLLMNILCATTDNPTLTVVACLFLGLSKIAALVEVYVIWLYIWSKKLDSSRFYPFVYCTALCGLFLITWFTTKLAYNYNWRYAYIWILILILICLLVTLVLVENHKLKKKIPLYQVDWIGLLLLTSSLMLYDYALVYGKVENWFDSKKIIASLFATVLTLLLFVKLELSIKRPLFDLNLFKINSFRHGLFYFLLLGIFVPSTFQSAFSVSILHYEMILNTALNLYMIPGIIVGSVLCYFWYWKKYDAELLIFTGFLAFVIYHGIMYNSFSVDFNSKDFILPLFIKGFAMAILYIAIGLYATNKLGIGVTLSAGGIMILIRSFLGSGTFSAIYNYLLYADRIKHFSYIASHTEANDFLIKQQGNTLDFYKNLQGQALLSASKEISGYIIITGILLLIFILTTYIHQKIKNKINAY
ncbi:MFS transporter [Flavobacterium sp. ZT3R17]|uniref:MFS transporter n=1 Tax=Flavobacterium cryoconiti TaxID=3398736 RepID=UPI003A8BC818